MLEGVNYINRFSVTGVIASPKRKLKLRTLSLGERYPKLLFLLCSVLVAFYLVLNKDVAPLQRALFSVGYLGTFVAGFLYAYSFTAIPATAIFLLLAGEQNLFFAVLAASMGAIIGDFLFFKLMRNSFSEELHRLSREKVVVAIGRPFHHFKRYALMMLAGIIISSPLPTEFGIAMFSSLKGMTTRRFLIITYLLHTLGIFVILLIGKMI